MADNKLGEQGGTAVAEALKTNRSLTALYLYSKHRVCGRAGDSVDAGRRGKIDRVRGEGGLRGKGGGKGEVGCGRGGR